MSKESFKMKMAVSTLAAATVLSLSASITMAAGPGSAPTGGSVDAKFNSVILTDDGSSGLLLSPDFGGMQNTKVDAACDLNALINGGPSSPVDCPLSIEDYLFVNADMNPLAMLALTHAPSGIALAGVSTDTTAGLGGYFQGNIGIQAIRDGANGMAARFEDTPSGPVSEVKILDGGTHKGIKVDTNNAYDTGVAVNSYDTGLSVYSSNGVGATITSPTKHALEATSTSEIAVYGTSTNSTGVYGKSTNQTGVLGQGVTGGHFNNSAATVQADIATATNGVDATSNAGMGVKGTTTTAGGFAGVQGIGKTYGVSGIGQDAVSFGGSFSGGNTGVIGSVSGASGIGTRGDGKGSGAGIAGYNPDNVASATGVFGRAEKSTGYGGRFEGGFFGVMSNAMTANGASGLFNSFAGSKRGLLCTHNEGVLVGCHDGAGGCTDGDSISMKSLLGNYTGTMDFTDNFTFGPFAMPSMLAGYGTTGGIAASGLIYTQGMLVKAPNSGISIDSDAGGLTVTTKTGGATIYAAGPGGGLTVNTASGGLTVSKINGTFLGQPMANIDSATGNITGVGSIATTDGTNFSSLYNNGWIAAYGGYIYSAAIGFSTYVLIAPNGNIDATGDMTVRNITSSGHIKASSGIGNIYSASDSTPGSCTGALCMAFSTASCGSDRVLSCNFSVNSYGAPMYSYFIGNVCYLGAKNWAGGGTLTATSYAQCFNPNG